MPYKSCIKQASKEKSMQKQKKNFKQIIRNVTSRVSIENKQQATSVQMQVKRETASILF